MLKVTESFGKVSQEIKETLCTMKPKENSDQRKSRLRREARQAKAAAANSTSKTDRKLASKSKPAIQVATNKPKPKAIIAKPRRVRKLETAG
jgi:transposase